MIKFIFKYILVFLYFSLAFFLLGISIQIIFTFIYLNDLHISYQRVITILVKSLITSSAITLAAIAFNLIDKYKSRKKTSSNQ